MEQQFKFSFRGTTNANTLDAWKTAGVEIEKRETKTVDKKTGKEETSVTYHRPEIAVNVEMPELEVLLENEVGVKVLNKLLHSAVEQIIRPYAEDNKVSDVPEITANAIWTVLQTPVKATALKATTEQMKEASAYFSDYLDQVGKTGKNAQLQIEFFQAKFSKSKLDKLAGNFYQQGATREQVLRTVEVVLTNVASFMKQVQNQTDETVVELLDVPTRICIQNIESWIAASKEAPEVSDLLNIENF